MQQALQKQHAGNLVANRSSIKQLPLFAASSRRQLQQQLQQRAVPPQSLRTEVAAPPAKDVVSYASMHNMWAQRYFSNAIPSELAANISQDVQPWKCIAVVNARPAVNIAFPSVRSPNNGKCCCLVAQSVCFQMTTAILAKVQQTAPCIADCQHHAHRDGAVTQEPAQAVPAGAS
jgi:hypothetical protein